MVSGGLFGKDDWATTWQAFYQSIDAEEWRGMHAMVREVTKYMGVKRQARGWLVFKMKAIRKEEQRHFLSDTAEQGQGVPRALPTSQSVGE